MRLATLIAFLVALATMAAAAYLKSGAWQMGLYGSVVAWSLTVLFGLCAVGETIWEGREPAVRAVVGLVAAAFALTVSRFMRPGSVPELPYQHLGVAAVSVAALGFALGALGLGLAAIGRRTRGLPGTVGALAMVVALLALSAWMNGR